MISKKDLLNPKNKEEIPTILLQAIKNTIGDGLILFDKKGVFIFLNEAAKELLFVKKDPTNLNRREVIKNRKKYNKYLLEYYFDPIKTFEGVVKVKESSRGNLIKINSKPPRFLETTYIPICNKTNEVTGVIANFRDVTKLKKQAEQIKGQLQIATEQKERWTAIFNNVEEGVFVLDKDSRIVQFNNSCELMSGYSEKEVLGKKIHKIFKCHDMKGNYYPNFSLIDKVSLTKEAIPYDEHLHTSRDGREIWVGVSKTPILNEEEEIEQIVGVIRDVTKLKEIEKAKSEFVSIASHELRTPLTVINGYLSLLLSGDLGQMGEIQNKLYHLNIINKIYSETKRLSGLVEELLNVTRIEEGRLKVDLKRTDYNELLEEVVNEFKPIASSKQIILSLEKPSFYQKDLHIYVDRDRIKEVLVNLIDNSIKYTGKGGRILLFPSVENSEVITSIQDTGIGIEPKLLNRIFEKFQQIPGSFLKENRGTGLGLFIVKGILDLHQGKIWVKSYPGEGSTFTFTFPAKITSQY